MANEKGDAPNLDDSNVSDHDPHFEPIITLPEINVSTLEEDEEEMIKLRAKLFRYDTNESPPEWKERGTGDVKLLRHRQKNTVRVVMRRDKTLKICANHFVSPLMDLKPNCGSDRAWVWSVPVDFADEIPRPELLAIRFATPENAKKWRTKFDEAKKIVVEAKADLEKGSEDDEDDDDDEYEEVDEEEVTKELSKLNVGEQNKEEISVGSKEQEKENPTEHVDAEEGATVAKEKDLFKEETEKVEVKV